MRNLIFAVFMGISVFASAQEKTSPPIPVELMFGNNRVATTLSINKRIDGKWRFNNITSLVADYQNTRSETELIVVNSVVYQFHKVFGASGGLQYHFLKGLVPNVAFHTSYADQTWLLVFTPYLNFLPDRNSETVAIVEFKPHLTDHLRLYARGMALYNHNITLAAHDRSFYYFRLGLTFGRKYTLGAAANFDYYGKNRVYKDNFGGFFKVDI